MQFAHDIFKLNNQFIKDQWHLLCAFIGISFNGDGRELVPEQRDGIIATQTLNYARTL